MWPELIGFVPENSDGRGEAVCGVIKITMNRADLMPLNRGRTFVECRLIKVNKEVYKGDEASDCSS